MTKKEQELQTRLLDLLDANNKVLEQICALLVKAASPLVAETCQVNPEQDIHKVATRDKDREVQVEAPETPEVTVAPEAPEAPEVDTEITPEYCRKALKAITKKTSTKEAKAFLAGFGDAKTIPQLDKKYYEDFIAGATQIMGAE